MAAYFSEKIYLTLVRPLAPNRRGVLSPAAL